eukprot:CAMPEP_0198503756 /NCGR_PEP_ID=MMETSP1462-20131121/10089_1 /TAXON_ID=1333877 /ORGANISM="Brandtodinium nutriculum, Strain RCC3387" /LENGTH=47 /DNA_ID= /DNA_START= /DNA_END= /DNA_ORIENTATION=
MKRYVCGNILLAVVTYGLFVSVVGLEHEETALLQRGAVVSRPANAAG